MDMLIIEDCGTTRAVFTRMFSYHYGLSVGSVAHGRAAFHLLHRMPVLPRLILCDIIMPEMDGLTFRFFQMHHPRLRHIPVMLISGHACFARYAKILNVDYFFEKPFVQQELIQIVGRYFPLQRVKSAPLTLYRPPQLFEGS